jgi:hypothetical protein
LYQPKKSATAEHGNHLGHHVLLNISAVAKSRYRDCLIQEATEIKLSPNMKRAERFSLNRSMKHLIHCLNERK